MDREMSIYTCTETRQLYQIKNVFDRLKSVMNVLMQDLLVKLHDGAFSN